MSAANLTSYSILFRFHCTIRGGTFIKLEDLQDDDRTGRVDRRLLDDLWDQVDGGASDWEQWMEGLLIGSSGWKGC